MKEQIEHIPINDAMANAGECPFCYIERRVEDHALDYVLGSSSSYMEYDTREATDKAGFCRAHFKKMYDYGNSLGNAWILSTHYNKIISEFTEVTKDFTPSKKGGLFSKKETTSNPIVDWVNARNQSCYICDGVKKNFDDYIKVFFDMYKKDESFRKQVAEGQGFCVTHFGILCDAADRELNEKLLKDFYEFIIPLMKSNLERVRDDVDWLIQKYDYRNKDADWKNSEDANQRGMQKLKGGYPAMETHKAKK
ncbi:MAG: hypothetical protein HUJ70_13140 [Pseudobutyrivibrio sp.]|nr:hypothetical protein [Pseudobutyrivibrio sp.]